MSEFTHGDLGPGPLAEFAPPSSVARSYSNGHSSAPQEYRAGVAIVMPAYREEQNLAATVSDFLDVPESAGIPHCVVVVNDGSPDRTGDVAEWLAAKHPGRVLVVHHETNRGYGAAVSTGIQAAIERLDYRWIFLTDSDGQFKAAQLPEFLAEAKRERADVVVGYRPRRADPLHRKVNAFCWTMASRVLLRVGIRDVDCAYKLIDRSFMREIALTGSGAATISPELVSKLRLQGARIIERPVEHFPREHGEQTGAKLSVIIPSILGLLALAFQLAGQRAPGRLLNRLMHPKDGVLALTTLAAACVSAGAYAYFLHRGVTLAYPDAVSHLLIARRVVDSPTVGAGQLGAVWLPLPHLVMLPFIWVNAWYYSGFAGSIISMIAYVMTVRYAYLITRGITESTMAGLVAAIAFGANPNVLYMQSTPMTELLLICCTAAAVYYLMRWCQDGRYIRLAATAFAALLATLSRYEGWVLFFAIAVVVAYVSWRRAKADNPAGLTAASRKESWRAQFHAVEADLLFYIVLGASGIAGWVLWNAVIFKDALYFQTGPFAKPSLWVSHSEAAIGNWGISIRTYLYAMADNASDLMLVLCAAGFAYYLYRSRLRTEAIAPLVLTAFVPFYIDALHSGQRPLHVTQVEGTLYNVRFGLLLVLPVAIFFGFLVTAVRRNRRAWLRRGGIAALAAAALTCAGLVWHGGIDTLREPTAFRASPSERVNAAVALWLRSHYHGGKVLMESFGNETVTFSSRIPLDEIVYEGSFQQWQPDLRDPAAHDIRWIYMRRTPGNTDQVYRALHGTARLHGYHIVYRDSARLIYERNGTDGYKPHRAVPKPAAAAPTSRGTVAPQPKSARSVMLTPVSAHSFDALGNDYGNENDGLAVYAIDNDPTTFWRTDYYYNYSAFGNLKQGTGLILDMGKQVRLRTVTVQFGATCCAHAQIEIGNDNTPTPATLGTFTPVQASSTAAGETTFHITKKAAGRYVLIWITDLPPQADASGKYEAQVYNVVLYGSAVGGAA